MNVKELMIGDLVRIKDSIDPNDAYWMHDDFHPGQVIRVEEILSDGVNPDWYGGEINDYIPEDAIGPIHITPEILEKNGFVPDNFSPYYLSIEDGSIRFSEHQYGLYCNILRPYQRYDGVCNYVHELQHALRLCRIEKEIVL